MATLAQVLNVSASSEVLTEETLDMIAANPIGVATANEIATLSGVDLAQRLVDAGLFERLRQAGAIASAILDLPEMRRLRLELQVQSTPAAQPQNISVELKQDPVLEQMRFGKLLEFISANPTDREARILLYAKTEVVEAMKKTEKFFFKAGAGGINIALVSDYVNFLGKSNSKPQRVYKGETPISLEAALGILERSLLHPLFANKAITDGLDEWSCDWSAVSRDVMKAVTWGRLTNHSYFPQSPDPIDCFDQITSSPLSRRWQAIADDYNSAIENEDPSTEFSLVYNREVEELKGIFGQIMEEAISPKKSEVLAINASDPEHVKLLKEKINRLNQALASETSAAIKFQLQQQITDAQELLQKWTTQTNIFGKLGNQSAEDAVRAYASKGTCRKPAGSSVKNLIVERLDMGSGSDVLAIVTDYACFGLGCEGAVYVTDYNKVSENLGCSIDIRVVSWEELLEICQQWRGALRG